jgi:hypothetical protein
MTNSESKHVSSLFIRPDQPLIGVLIEEGGEELVQYFSEDEAYSELADNTRIALQLAGAWGDLDWQDMEQELERIRHETPPSPPLSL